MQKKTTVHYYTNFAPHYREKLWKRMAGDSEFDFHFHFGTSKHGSIKEIDFNSDFWDNRSKRLHSLKNRYLFNRLVWQSGVVTTVLSGNVKKGLFLGDMNILSTWIAACCMRIMGKSVFFWGHGFSGSEVSFKKYLRILFNKLAHGHFLYGEHAKKIMITYGFAPDKIHLVYNSLDYDEHKILREKVVGNKETLGEHFKYPQLPVLVFIGRLTPIKKLNLLIKAAEILNRQKYVYNVLIIGDGEMSSSLQKMALQLLPKGSFHFYGACYDEEEIGGLLANSDLCISPGNVGLTAIHSLSFGTPVCTHDNFQNQMPEFEAVIQGETGIFFRENDPDDLATNIKSWFDSNRNREEVRIKCYRVIDEDYNPETQMKTFKKGLIL